VRREVQYNEHIVGAEDGDAVYVDIFGILPSVRSENESSWSIDVLGGLQI